MKIYIKLLALILLCFTFISSCLKQKISPNSIENEGQNKINDAHNNKVKVFILAGQSNMVGTGTIEPRQQDLDKNSGRGTLRYLVTNATTKDHYAHLVDENGDWSARDDVWLIDLDHSAALTVKDKLTFGPELQFGHVVGDFYSNKQVIIIKTSWGGKSLYSDFRPPSSGQTIGPFYTKMIDRIYEVLNDLGRFYPNYQGEGYEIVGFGWHQGWNDRINQTANDEYQENCVNLINDIREEFKVSDMPFVIATTGIAGWNETHPRAISLMNAQLNVPTDDRLKIKMNVKTVETRDSWRDIEISPDTNQGYHWNRNAETYFLIGKSMGDAMINLLKK